MSLFFGGGSKTKPQYTGLGVQTSTNSTPVTILLGMNRITINVITQTDFKSHKHKQGKGGGKGGTSYTYSGTYLLALCFGVVTDIPRMWKDQSKNTDYASLGFVLFTGEADQAPWGYLVSAHPDMALGYPHIAYLAVANYDLGNSNVLGQHSFEVQGPLYNTQVDGTGDADPALCVDALINDPIYGAVGGPMNSVTLSNMMSTGAATTTGDNTFQTYCRAMGFGLSPALVDQNPCKDVIERWSKLCNTAIFWTGSALKFMPRGTEEIDAHGVKFIPELTIRYSLTDKDFLPGDDEDPITFDRIDPADRKNIVTLNIRNRGNEYNPVPAEWRDGGLIDQFGEKPIDTIEAPEVCEPSMGALMAAMMGQRVAYICNTYSFKLSPAYSRLEPMDILECYDPRWGTFLVQIVDIEEDDNDELSITAEEFAGPGSGVGASPGGVSVVPVENDPINTEVSPGPINPPIIFEPPSSLAGSTAQIWVAVSGGDGTDYNPNWGGANAYVSTDDITYNQIGSVDFAARMGKLTSILATYGGTNPDTVHTLQVDLAMSGGELSDASSSSDAENGVTRSYVDGEVLSYEVATLTSGYAYDCDDLWRGQYGTSIGAHGVGSDFARLDDAIFKYELPPEYIGVTLYLKFQSYNIFGGGLEDLASVTAYTYTPTGEGFGTGTGGIPATPTGLSGSAGTTFARLTWNANSVNDGVTGYQVWRATGASQPFGSASIIGTTTGLEYTDAAVVGGTAYTYFLVATNVIGSSGNTTGVNLTPTAGSAITLWQVFDTGTGASQGITIPYANPNEVGVFVYVNGIRYETDEYSISGTTLTLTTNAAGDSIEVVGVTQ